MKTIRTSILPIVFVLLMWGVSQACPTCKEGVAENGGNLVRGYFWSILFMMSMPFLIVGGLSSLFYLDVRRARRKQDSAGEPSESRPVPVGST